MTRDLSILAFVVTVGAVVLLGRRERSKVPSAEELLSRVMTTRTGRACSLLFWVWVGWHFFAR